MVEKKTCISQIRWWRRWAYIMHTERCVAHVSTVGECKIYFEDFMPYGLVLKDYAHFTSPIRRYPDLAIHRIMTDLLSGTDKETMAIRYTDFAAQAAKQSSEREVIAVQIERKAEDCYKAEYARRHLGECYEGIISGVTQRGLFVELENGVEGFVPASSLTATGTTLTEGIRLSDPVSGKNWNLGDSMMITIVRADVNLGKVDFEVAPENKQ